MNTETNAFDESSKSENLYDRVKAMAAGTASDPLHVRFWSHEVDIPLIGTILDFSGFEHARYGHQRTVIVEREGGEIVSAILTNYLDKGMTLKEAEIGDRVYIEKKAIETSKHGNQFNKFIFAVDKDTPNY